MPDTGRRPRPVLLLDLAKAAVAVAVGFGFLAADHPVAQAITAGGGLVVFALLTLITQHRVTPLAAPRDATGQQLLTPDPPGRHRLALAENVADRNGYAGFEHDHPAARPPRRNQ